MTQAEIDAMYPAREIKVHRVKGVTFYNGDYYEPETPVDLKAGEKYRIVFCDGETMQMNLQPDVADHDQPVTGVRLVKVLNQ